ncbi:MAG TPA: TldD/PmbA family protein [Gemmatimonadaceae bacterium]|nr:TldD/PmbA family protein [Gemmatimonadaceae bacterium]
MRRGLFASTGRLAGAMGRLPADFGPGDFSIPQALALRAIDAARSAGAAYADARLTRTVEQEIPGQLTRDWEELAISVRALVHGYWGFAASPLWDAEEAAQLGREAVAQAKALARTTPRTVDLGPSVVASGTWSMPVRSDPFAIPLEEKIDFLESISGVAAGNRRNLYRQLVSTSGSVTFARQERTVGTTEGALFSQVVYRSEVNVTLNLGDGSSGSAQVQAKGSGIAAKGWEHVLDMKPHDQIPALIEQAEMELGLPRKPVEIGRYDLVLDGEATAHLLDSTIGIATDLDRVVGNEADAAGTSYIDDPLGMLGSFAVGSALLTVTGDRSERGGLATVRWDDEGVEPAVTTLIKDGILNDFPTTREQASWLAPWYERQGQPIRSRGCARADSALNITMGFAPNLTMRPGAVDVAFEDLIRDVKRGIAVIGGYSLTDFQARNGRGAGRLMREIVNGKLGAVIEHGTFLFNSVEVWKGLMALGGARSVTTIAGWLTKGQPPQSCLHSVTAPAAVFKNVAIIDGTKRA